MKTIYITRFLILLSLGLFVFACKELESLDPGKNLKLILNYKPADSFIEAQVRDAKTGQLIASNINIEIIGNQSANIINFEGEAKSNYSKKGPSIYIGLKNIIPTVKTPANFKIIISADGYLSNSLDVSLTGVSNPPVSISLVKISNPPTGSVIQQSSLTTSATNGVSQDKTLEVVNGLNSTIVQIDKGTIMRNSAGTALSGNMTTTIATFSGNSKEASRALPGGNIATLAKGPNGETNLKAMLLPLAFADIIIKDANGANATQFDKLIDISFEISPNTINPKTKKKINEGESFSVFSYNNEKAIWTYEKEGKIIKTGNDYFVTFKTNHLSYYGVGWLDLSFINVLATITFEGVPSSNSIDAFGNLSNLMGYMNSLKDYSVIFPLDFSVPDSPFSAYTGYSGNAYIIEHNGQISSDRMQVSITGLFLSSLIEKAIIKFLHPNSGKDIEIEISQFDLQQMVRGEFANYIVKSNGVAQKTKTAKITVSCENKCALEILPYNVGIEYSKNLSATTFDPFGYNDWSFLGNVSYDPTDKQIKLRANLPDNTDFLFRAIAYPEYSKQINTGTGDTFDAPIILPKTHPLCNCGK